MMTLGAVREVRKPAHHQAALPPSTPLPIAPGARPGPDGAGLEARRLRESIFTIAGLVLVGVVVLACLFAALFVEGSPEDKTWAKTVVIGVIAGTLGFLGGRQSRSAVETMGRA